MLFCIYVYKYTNYKDVIKNKHGVYFRNICLVFTWIDYVIVYVMSENSIW
jgi:hypothetical protein